jgi:hypothetical protein
MSAIRLMRFKNAGDFCRGVLFANGMQRGGNLGGVMGVVVDDGHSTSHANGLQASLQTGELPQSANDFPRPCSSKMGHSGRGGRIPQIVKAGNGKLNIGDRPPSLGKAEAIASSQDR